jgi:hypothetical protein
MNERGTEAAAHLAKVLISVLVESWSFDLLPPSVKLDSLGELSLKDYDTLETEATKLMPELFPALKESQRPKSLKLGRLRTLLRGQERRKIWNTLTASLGILCLPKGLGGLPLSWMSNLLFY